MRIEGRDVVAVLKTTWREMGEDKVSVYAAQMAYAFFFSLFPLLLFFAALFSLVADKQTVQSWFDTRLASALPGDVAGLLGTTLKKVVFAENAPGILSFGLLTAAWSGSGVFGALRGALNDAYDVTERRPWWKQYAIQLGMLALSGIVLLASTIILLNGEGVMAWIGSHLHLARITTFIWTVLQFPLAIGGVVAVLWLIYSFLPNCKHQGKLVVLLGATLATLLWLAATLLFRLYVQKFNQLNPAYGAVGAIMVLLTWMYYSSYVLLAVGELISVVEKSKEAEPRPNESVARERALVSFGARHWVDAAVARLHADVGTARAEVAEVVRAVTIGSATVAVGGVAALLGALSVIVGVVLLLGDQWLPSDLFWVAGLLVVLTTGPVAYWLGRRGRALIAEAIAPRERIETLSGGAAD